MNDSAHSEAEHRQPILFFDGVCGLCNRFVDFMLRTDSQHLFRYAPLQGETARRLLEMDDQAGDHEAGSVPQNGGSSNRAPTSWAIPRPAISDLSFSSIKTGVSNSPMPFYTPWYVWAAHGG